MVRQAGFEPATPWFVARYSNPTELLAHMVSFKRESNYIVNNFSLSSKKYKNFSIPLENLLGSVPKEV